MTVSAFLQTLAADPTITAAERERRLDFATIALQLEEDERERQRRE